MNQAHTTAGDTPGRPRLPIPQDFAPELHELCNLSRAHDVEIKAEDGRVLFTQKGVEAPARWSKRAVQVAASKYLYGDPSKPNKPLAEGGREHSIYSLHRRVAWTIARSGRDQGYFDADAEVAFRDELMAITLGQYGAFNSPVWFNVGLDAHGVVGNGVAYGWEPEEYDLLGSYDEGRDVYGTVGRVEDTYKRPQGSACFIQSVADDLKSIMDLATNEAMLFKYGSGSGTDLSPIRSKREKLAGGGTPSGPLSFMRIYDAVASVVKSGGKTRRAAKMQTLHVGHPDILDFIRAKPLEEAKAHALIAQGYDANFNGEAYGSVAFQNANLSVRITDDFLHHLEAELPYPLRAVTNGVVVERINPADLWDELARATWQCGDPAVQFADTINEWHTTPFDAAGKPTPINSSNPCSEYLSVDDSACNLASINLGRFVLEDGTFDKHRFRSAVRTLIIAQDILVDLCSYPTAKIARNAHDYRQLGLGFANLGGLIQSQGLPYDSEEARLIAGSISALLGGWAYDASVELATHLAPFAAYRNNARAMIGVIRNHRDAAEALRQRAADFAPGAETPLGRTVGDLAELAGHVWGRVVYGGKTRGFRNAQATVIAPTGTISFMMDCDTTGIEPNLALVATKTLAGGGTMNVVNRLVREALASMGFGFADGAPVERYIALHGTAEGCPGLTDRQVAVFDTSFAPPGFSRTIAPEAHLLMMAEVQRFISGAISKTVNVPESFTPGEIAGLYWRAWELDLKCVAIYRDNSKGSQPLTAGGTPPQPGPSACHKCGHATLQQAGTCTICPSCGEPQGGCS